MRFRTLLVLAPLALAFACSRTDPAPGELMLAVQTDMHAPKDVDAVGLYVAERDLATSHDTLIFGFAERVAPDGTVHFPATLAVVGRKNPGATVRVRAVAFRGNQARIVRDAITTIPTDRAALLRLPLRWIDDNGKASGSFAGDGSVGSTSLTDLRPLAGGDTSLLDGFLQISSGCPDDSTEVNGGCAPAAIDSTTLPDYSEADVFGGGTPDGGGACFDAAKCFGGAARLALDLASCSAPAPQGPFALAIATAPGDRGDCAGGACYVPLDQDAPEGFTVQGGRVVLPGAYCARIQSGDALGVVSNTPVPGCEKKSNDAPLCGPASAVGPPGIGTDDAGAIVDSSDSATDGSPLADAATFSVDGIPTPLVMAHDATNIYVVTMGGKVMSLPRSGAPPVTLGGFTLDAGVAPTATDFQMVLVGNFLVVGEPGSTSFSVIPTAGGQVIPDGTFSAQGTLKLLGVSNGKLAYMDQFFQLRPCTPGTPNACANDQSYSGSLPSGINPTPSQAGTDPVSGLFYAVGATQKNTDIEVWREGNPTFAIVGRGPIRSSPPLTSGALAFDGANAFYVQAETQGNIFYMGKSTGTVGSYLATPEDLSSPVGEPVHGLGLNPKFTKIFWTNAAGDLRGSDLAAKSPVTLVPGANARQLYADDQYVYYTVFTKPTGAVHRVAWAPLVGP